MTITAHLQGYAQRIRDLRRANPDVPEPALAPEFRQLLLDLFALLPGLQGPAAVPEYREPGIGRPDIALIRAGAPPRSFVELKAPNLPADPTRWRGRDKGQFERFSELPCWAACNFSEIRLLERGEEVGSAVVVPERCLRPDRNDARADADIAAHDAAPLMSLLRRLRDAAGHEPVARDAEHLASMLAHSARLVRGIVQERLAELRAANNETHPLIQVRDEFRDVLYVHPEAGGYPAADFDVLFSGAFAQTLAFGLLLVREATNTGVDENAWTHMPAEHPLMRSALRVLTQPEVRAEMGVGFSVLCDTVNSFAPELLAVREDGFDPILYFYEYFLATFDPEGRERYGVYYTPIEVVRYMVGALDRALRVNLATTGLSDPNVTILDPATGTGTFLLGIAERVRAQAVQRAGEGMAAHALNDLAGRMYGLELLIGPYAVAHYRLRHSLKGLQTRLGVYLADTLAEPGAAGAMGRLGFIADGIRGERREANRVKSEQPILAIIGNLPYRRLEVGENRTLVGNWMDGLWDDLKEPVRAAEQGNQLNTFPELSVAFWRWAIWKLFESQNAPERGVVAFITNRKFLTGWPYAGLRQMLRRRFDHIEIIDLRGDARRGERGGVEGDEGVFNIQVGTAITLAIADGSKPEGALAEIRYTDSWELGLLGKRAKLDALLDWANGGTPSAHTPIHRGELDDFRPAPFQDGEWISLSEAFVLRISGIQTKRDDFIYAVSRPILSNRIERFRAGDEALASQFSPTTARPLHAARSIPFDAGLLAKFAYRPLDTRWTYQHRAYMDRPRPELQEAWGRSNACIYALPGGTGSGPAI